MTEPLRSFVLTTEDGAQHLIHYSETQSSEPAAGSSETGALHCLIMKTSTGDPVHRLSKGFYEVMTSFGSVRATSDDPDAP